MTDERLTRAAVALRALNITGRTIAKRTRVTPAAVSLWLQGRRIPHPKQRARVEREYGIPSDWWAEAA